MACNQVEIVFRPLADPKLNSLLSSSQLSSSKPTTSVPQPSASNLKGKSKIVHPPLLTHWAVKVTLETSCFGYEEGDYYYGLVTEDNAPKLCVIDTTIWESMGSSSQRLRGLTAEIPPELFVKASTIIQRTKPYDIMSNNCQDFAIKFFLDTCTQIFNLEQTLETLRKGHHGFNALIKYKRDTETGDYLIYDRGNKLITRFDERGDVEKMHEFVSGKKKKEQVEQKEDKGLPGWIRGSLGGGMRKEGEGEKKKVSGSSVAGGKEGGAQRGVGGGKTKEGVQQGVGGNKQKERTQVGIGGSKQKEGAQQGVAGGGKQKERAQQGGGGKTKEGSQVGVGGGKQKEGGQQSGGKKQKEGAQQVGDGKQKEGAQVRVVSGKEKEGAQAGVGNGKQKAGATQPQQCVAGQSQGQKVKMVVRQKDA
ncbi:hypothetical protein QBC38DRAFT_526801 [Podospora fimiseda]|uniref:Uncharacterized protein n=1 Tax=Podospora fimiseda TaxID=252190 RepID=A0AAN7BQN9_9PEZI|nr:hypothetical protein QBC38DRAFT_526801 [Podospora fimiseda]